MQAADWTALSIFQLISAIAVPIVVLWGGLVARDRRAALADKLSAIQENFRSKLSNIERQIVDLRNEVRDGRNEAKEGRKECAEDIRAISAQASEYPRRREMQDAISEVWREIREWRARP